MRINPKDTLGGVPVLEARRLLDLAARRDFVSRDFFQHYGHLGRTRATRFIEALIAQRFLERGYPPRARGKWYTVTLDGRTFMLASAARPLTRRTAERKLQEFLERVRYLNISEHYLYCVKKVLVFGSYLGQSERINDIDVAVELEPRFSDRDEQHEREKIRVQEARRAGRQFSNIVSELFWPQHEVLLFLKSRSRAISLHTTDDAILDRVTTVTVFDASAPNEATQRARHLHDERGAVRVFEWSGGAFWNELPDALERV